MKGFLLDTSFFIRLSKTDDPLYSNTVEYWNYISKGNKAFVSTISIAEYCVRGNQEDILQQIVVPISFTINFCVNAAEITKAAMEIRNQNELEIERRYIANDAKLLATASQSENIHYFISSDEKLFNLYERIKKENPELLNFQFLLLQIPIADYPDFGLFPSY